MSHLSDHTIFALASGAGRAGVSVFRVSGPGAGHVVKTLTKRLPPKPRLSVIREFKTQSGEVIDAGLLIWMPGPRSFTGEDVAEFHTHGSLAVIEAMADAFTAAGARQAGPGEFTRRAFDNGRMDLTEAEGLADLIDADTESQRRQALRQMQGGLRDVYEAWRSHLIDALAAIEGEIDFPDEQDIPDALSHAAYGPLQAALSDMRARLEDSERGERIRAGLDVTIIGPPNAGKSTLINYLAGRDAAIVTDEAGTTRDVIDVHMVMAGLPIRLSDTAGLRETENVIEAEGVRRAKARSETSDIRIAMVDASQDIDVSLAEALSPGDFLLINKIDVAGAVKINVPHDDIHIFKISAKDGRGLPAFQAALEAAITDRFSVGQNAGLTRARHKACAAQAITALTRAVDHLGVAPELAGDDVRAALHAIKELAGEADIEAVLERIFARFCVGK